MRFYMMKNFCQMLWRARFRRVCLDAFGSRFLDLLGSRAAGAFCASVFVSGILLSSLPAESKKLANIDTQSIGALNTNTRDLGVQDLGAQRMQGDVKSCLSTQPSATGCLSGFYKVPNFLIFKGGYVYVLVHEGRIFAYGVENLDKSPAGKDPHNPIKSLRERSDKGTIFLKDLKILGMNLRDGFSYNFQNGSTYYTKGKILDSGDLELSFALDSMHILGKSFVWERLSDEQASALGLQKLDNETALKTLVR